MARTSTAKKSGRPLATKREVAGILNRRMRRLVSEPSRKSLRTKSKRYQFPKKFMWGSASASHQVAGSGRKNSNWGCFEESGGRTEFLLDTGVPENRIHEFIAGDACQFESRFRSDFALLKSLGHNTVRFSINWATIEPHKGVYDKKVLENYRAMIKCARENGLKVVLTLYHWTHAMWFEEAGGWTLPNAAGLFLKMVKVALPYLKGVKIFTTLNEPNVYTLFSYRWKEWPPGMGTDEAHDLAATQLLAAHRLVYRHIKKHMPKAIVGVAMAVNWNESNDPKKKFEEDKFFTNWLIVWKVEGVLDIIGIQTYMHSYWDTENEANNRFGWDGHDKCTPDKPVQSDMIGVKHEHWGMCPEAIYHTVKEVWERFKIPVMVTEHGHSIAELEDHKRCWYLWESIGWLEKAMQEGVKLIGYLHWSTMDNFEWLYGWRSKFGLIHIDLETQKRTPRKSAYLYRCIIKARGRDKKTMYRYSGLIKHPHAHAA